MSLAVGSQSAEVLRAPGWRRYVQRHRPYLAIWPATILLFAVSPLIASGSSNLGALQSSLPFAAILAIVATGQTLVIQQRGLDLAVPGIVSLATVLVARSSDTGPDLAKSVIIALIVSALAGVLSGLAVTGMNITPLIATLGMNAILLGTILKVTHGGAGATVTGALANFSVGRMLGVPNIVVVAGVLIAWVAVVMRTTRLGRTFIAIGTSASAARVAGMPVNRYIVGTYAVAGILYGVAGILLAGYLKTPGTSAGTSYLLPSIAAVVLGGTSLAGGGGSVVATAVGAVFLTQLQQVVFGAGAATSVQLLIQSAVIGIGMAARTIPWAEWARRLRRSEE